MTMILFWIWHMHDYACLLLSIYINVYIIFNSNVIYAYMVLYGGMCTVCVCKYVYSKHRYDASSFSYPAVCLEPAHDLL